MAQANSAAAREPSMEEILASIRRIIEDSDGARRPGDDFHTDSVAPAAGAEYAAQPDHDADNDAGVEIEAFRSELAASVVEVEPRLNGAHAANGAQFGQDRAPDTRPLAESRPQAEIRTIQEPIVSAPVRHHEEAAPAEDAGARGAIISDFAGRQVAAAFEELSEAFTASRKRSYDEIAEEIMRPMLQDWLDNNLPLLVERLVREEIERVARGGVR